jgi:hypothetical protein
MLMVLGILTVGVMVAAHPAQAIVFDLTSNHCTVPADCGAPGTIFGTVTLTQIGSSVGVVVDLNSPYVWAKTGSADFTAFKFNATGVAVGEIAVTQTFAGQTLVAQAGSFPGDGTGAFGFAIVCSTCGNGISTISSNIEFTVANALIADLTAANASGNVFVADLGNSTNGATGPIDATAPHSVAEPSSLLFVGSAMAIAGMLGRRWRRR